MYYTGLSYNDNTFHFLYESQANSTSTERNHLDSCDKVMACAWSILIEQKQLNYSVGDFIGTPLTNNPCTYHNVDLNENI